VLNAPSNSTTILTLFGTNYQYSKSAKTKPEAKSAPKGPNALLVQQYRERAAAAASKAESSDATSAPAASSSGSRAHQGGQKENDKKQKVVPIVKADLDEWLLRWVPAALISLVENNIKILETVPNEEVINYIGTAKPGALRGWFIQYILPRMILSKQQWKLRFDEHVEQGYWTASAWEWSNLTGHSIQPLYSFPHPDSQPENRKACKRVWFQAYANPETHRWPVSYDEAKQAEANASDAGTSEAEEIPWPAKLSSIIAGITSWNGHNAEHIERLRQTQARANPPSRLELIQFIKAVTPAKMTEFFKQKIETDPEAAKPAREKIRVFMKLWGDEFKKLAPEFLDSGELTPKSPEYLPLATFVRFSREPDLRSLVGYVKPKGAGPPSRKKAELICEDLDPALDPFAEGSDLDDDDPDVDDPEEEDEEEDEDETGQDDDVNPLGGEHKDDEDDGENGDDDPPPPPAAPSAPKPAPKKKPERPVRGSTDAHNRPTASKGHAISFSDLHLTPPPQPQTRAVKVQFTELMPQRARDGSPFHWTSRKLPLEVVDEFVEHKAATQGLPVCAPCSCEPSWQDGDDLWPDKNSSGNHCNECTMRSNKWDACCCWIPAKDRVYRDKIISFDQFRDMAPMLNINDARWRFTALPRADTLPDPRLVEVAALFADVEGGAMYADESDIIWQGEGPDPHPRAKTTQAFSGTGRKLSEADVKTLSNKEYAQKLLQDRWFQQECQLLLQGGGKHQRELSTAFTKIHGQDPLALGLLNQGVFAKYARMHEGFAFDPETKIITTNRPLVVGPGRILADSRGLANRKALAYGKTKRVVRAICPPKVSTD
jgi:hypothetical protein